MQLPQRVLCLVTALEPDDDPGSLIGKVRAAVRGGANMVQVRAPALERTRFFDLAAAVKDAVGDDALVMVNNRVDVALAIDASGVQLGERGPAVNAARRAGGPEWLIGRSVHGVDSAKRAEADGADFLLLGAIYETESHPGRAAAGPGFVRDVAASVTVPILGIGGIDADRVGEVVAAGARGVAVIGAILRAPDPERAAAELWSAVSNAPHAGPIEGPDGARPERESGATTPGRASSAVRASVERGSWPMPEAKA